MIFPNNMNTPIDGIKQIEIGVNPGIAFGREPDPELLRIAERYQEKVEKYQSRAMDMLIDRLGRD
jgi:hypothetical protein